MKNWYVLRTKSGHEKKAKENIEKQLSALGLSHKIGSVIVPMAKLLQKRGDRNVIVEKKIMPGYIIVELEMDEEIAKIIRNIPSVAGFLGGKNPKPLTKEEVRGIMNLQGTEEDSSITPAVLFEKGQKVKIVEGPYNSFSGIIEEVHREEGKLKIKIEIFGQTTLIDVGIKQVVSND